jgi:hypothetical protein
MNHVGADASSAQPSEARQFSGYALHIWGRGFASASVVRGQCWQSNHVKETLELINQMQADGVIGKYAIGGAVGATFYLQPVATFDVDVFVTLPTSPGGSLLSLASIYDYLKNRGGVEEDEYIVIGGWPVQFLPPSDALEEEAVAEAITATVEGVGTRVISAEHLVAIGLRTGRPKDHNRILQFIEQDAVDRKKLETILDHHGLASRWKQFEHKYFGGIHE